MQVLGQRFSGLHADCTQPSLAGSELTVPELLAYLDAIAPAGRMDAQLTVDRRVALMLAAWCSLRSGEVRALGISKHQM